MFRKRIKVSGREHMDSSKRPQQKMGRVPKLDRRNAIKNIDYEAVASGSISWASSSSDDSPGVRTTRSLDLHNSQTSFRIGGSIEGEVDLICRTLGLSGPEDFAIPVAAWEARKARSSSDLLPRSRLLHPNSPPLSPPPPDPTSTDVAAAAAATTTTSGANSPSNCEDKIDAQPVEDGQNSRLPDRFRVGIRVTNDEPAINSPSSIKLGGGNGGIRGVRPPILAPPLSITVLAPPPSRSILAPPPSMLRPVLDHMSSTWDIMRSLAPEDDDHAVGLEGGRRRSFDSEEDEEVPGRGVEGEEVRLGETAEDLTGSCSFSTSNDDDSSSTTTEFRISPNGRFKRNISSWIRGQLLGSGSFGTVYEGISDDGFFFAVKEVSLLDQGSNAQQCILQLEQEIALLSRFEHENIVQYLGTDKEEAKLYIFLELVTQGSLSSLYQKYHLRDSQVSAYTRQILSGLRYLHDQNVVHRDIKCANILVDASGSVKLADFGLAKETTKLNMLKSCKGSVYWMAPEVVNPKRTYGPAADIWSLGCTVLEMLTRQLPYPDMEWAVAFFKIGRGEQPPIPNSLSKEARDFIRQCVQVDPDDRPPASKLLEHPFVKRPLPAYVGSDYSSRNGDRRS